MVSFITVGVHNINLDNVTKVTTVCFRDENETTFFFTDGTELNVKGDYRDRIELANCNVIPCNDDFELLVFEPNMDGSAYVSKWPIVGWRVIEGICNPVSTFDYYDMREYVAVLAPDGRILRGWNDQYKTLAECAAAIKCDMDAREAYRLKKAKGD